MSRRSGRRSARTPDRPIYIETVARSGYRFIAAVTWDPADEEPSAPSAMARPVELYEFVGRGRSHLLSGSYFELPAAVEAFRSAIEIDPTYAPAHAGLARARCVQATLRAVPHQEAFAEAKASALRALAMDSASRTRRWPSEPCCFSASGTGRRRSAACAERSKSIPITPKRSCSMGRCRKRSGGSTMACVSNNRRWRAIRDRPAFWCKSRCRIGISGSTTTRSSGPAGARRGSETSAGQRIHRRRLLEDRRRRQIRGIERPKGRRVRLPEETLAKLKQVTAQMQEVYATAGIAALTRFMAGSDHERATGLRHPAEDGLLSCRLYGAAGRLDEAFECLDQAIETATPHSSTWPSHRSGMGCAVTRGLTSA